MTVRSAIPVFLTVFAGLVAWSAHFLTIYAVAATVCERGGPPLAVHAAVLAATAVALAAVAASLAAVRRLALDRADTTDFVRGLATLVALLSAIAIVFGGLPALFVPACT